MKRLTLLAAVLLLAACSSEPETPAPAPTPAPTPAAAEPAPAPAEPAPAPIATTPIAPAPIATAPQPEPPPPAPPPAPAPKGWMVVVASESSEGAAAKMVEALKKKGYEAQVQSTEVKGVLWHRAVIANVKSHKEAVELAVKVEKDLNVKGAWVSKGAP